MDVWSTVPLEIEVAELLLVVRIPNGNIERILIALTQVRRMLALEPP